MRPLGDRVLLNVGLPTGKLGLIVIPHKYRQTPQEGVVRAVGPQVHTVRVGDRVLFGRYSTQAVEPHGVLIRERDIMGVLERADGGL